MTRQERIEALRDRREVSVLIVGGGINGVGLLRELTLQGVDTLLVDRSDFCAGTSAASTRIIHGGLRYLENREFRLVKESVRERNGLLKSAPHYVHPLPTTIPIFSWARGFFPALGNFLGVESKPGQRGALLFKIGLSLYDLYAGRQSLLPTHRFFSRDASLGLRPQLNLRSVCTAVYYDAAISYPERLCLEMVLDAEALSPNVGALNYVQVQQAARDTVILADQISGELFPIKPHIVVNATGAWIDFTNRALQRETRYIGGTKGLHVVIDHPELLEATQGHLLYFCNTDGRICIFYPFYGKVIAGSTDIPVSDPDTAFCDEDEVDYILESIRQVFPAIRIDRAHIVFRFCGVRPLPRSDALTPGQISRDHICELIPPGNGIEFPVYSLIGGKLTTFRAFCEQVAGRLLQLLRRPQLTSSAEAPIGGGKDYPRTAAAKKAWLTTWQAKTGLSLSQLETLLDRYGTRAEAIAEYSTSEPDAALRFHPEYTRREIQFIAAHERVIHLDDLILRRTIMALLGQLSLDLLEELAAVVAPVLGWSKQEIRQEVERTVEILERTYGITREQLCRGSAEATGKTKQAN